MISPERVERMKGWRHSGFHAFAGEEIPDIPDAMRVGRYMVRGPAATSRLRTNPAQEPKLRYLAKGAVPDNGEETVSSGYRWPSMAIAGLRTAAVRPKAGLPPSTLPVQRPACTWISSG